VALLRRLSWALLAAGLALGLALTASPLAQPTAGTAPVKPSAPAGILDARGYLSAPLDQLGSFAYRPHGQDAQKGAPPEPLPAWLLALHGRKVEMTGAFFMREIREARYTQLYLYKDKAAISAPPLPQQVVFVTASPGSSIPSSVPERSRIRVRGTFSVDEQRSLAEGGLLRLEADSIEVAGAPAARAKGYQHLSFSRLGFRYRPVYVGFGRPRQGTVDGSDAIPASIQALDGRKVFCEGFMIPTEMKGDKVAEFVLVKSRLSCCFGVIPKANEWVLVRPPAGAEADYIKDMPLKVSGILRVAPIREAGQCVGLYRLQPEQVEPVPAD
jgi:hypothetical protein